MNNQEEKIKTSVFFIEATSYEQLMLWSESHKDTDWEQDLMGFSQIIGYIDDDKEKPVNLSFSFAKLFGQRICFYEAISRYVDHEMVEDWLWNNYPVKWDNDYRRAYTNAMNFHHAIDHCTTLSQAQN